MEVRWGVPDSRQWLWVMVAGEWGVHVCVTATDRIQQTKLGLYGHKYGRGGGGGGVKQEERKEEKKGGGEGGREDEGAACSSLIPSNIPLDDRAWSKER